MLVPIPTEKLPKWVQDAIPLREEHEVGELVFDYLYGNVYVVLEVHENAIEDGCPTPNGYLVGAGLKENGEYSSFQSGANYFVKMSHRK